MTARELMAKLDTLSEADKDLCVWVQQDMLAGTVRVRDVEIDVDSKTPTHVSLGDERSVMILVEEYDPS